MCSLKIYMSVTKLWEESEICWWPYFLFFDFHDLFCLCFLQHFIHVLTGIWNTGWNFFTLRNWVTCNYGGKKPTFQWTRMHIQWTAFILFTEAEYERQSIKTMGDISFYKAEGHGWCQCMNNSQVQSLNWHVRMRH